MLATAGVMTCNASHSWGGSLVLLKHSIKPSTFHDAALTKDLDIPNSGPLKTLCSVGGKPLSDLQAKTKIKLGATAGLRLLEGGKADAILKAVKQYLQKSPFDLDKDTGVTILDGQICYFCACTSSVVLIAWLDNGNNATRAWRICAGPYAASVIPHADMHPNLPPFFLPDHYQYPMQSCHDQCLMRAFHLLQLLPGVLNVRFISAYQGNVEPYFGNVESWLGQS